MIATTIEDVNAAKLSELAAARYKDEVGGITMNGITIATDRESREGMKAVKDALDTGLYTNTQFKVADGSWVPVTSETIAPVWEAVQNHVRACFLREFSLVSVINAATTTEEIEAVTWATSLSSS